MSKASFLRPRAICFALCMAILALLFYQTLYGLARVSVSSDLNSHLLAMPLISAYLIFIRRKRLPAPSNAPAAFVFCLFAAAAAAVALASRMDAAGYEGHESLSLRAFAFVMALVACAALCWGRAMLRATAVPAALLLFMVPLPDELARAAAEGLQSASASAVTALFALAQMPAYREGMTFLLPGLSIEIAEECSGIRSTLALFISSIVAAEVFLRSPWKKVFLVALVIPLGILRNGIRILVICWLTLHVNPAIIRGPLHHNGGPIFFVLSLAILLAVLWTLMKTEKPRTRINTAGGAET